MERWKIAAILGAFVIGIAIGWNLDAVGVKKTKIGWKFGDSELTIDLKNDLSSPDVLLNKIFSEEFSRLGTIELLKLRYGIFPFNEVELVDKIATLSIDDPVSIKLRELRESRKGPFAYQVDTVRIGIPLPEHQPPEGYANVCQVGKYIGCRGRCKILICHLETDKEIQVEDRGYYACPIKGKYPDIQLNIEDAKRLLGDSLSYDFNAISVILD